MESRHVLLTEHLLSVCTASGMEEEHLFTGTPLESGFLSMLGCMPISTTWLLKAQTNRTLKIP